MFIFNLKVNSKKIILALTSLKIPLTKMKKMFVYRIDMATTSSICLPHNIHPNHDMYNNNNNSWYLVIKEFLVSRQDINYLKIKTCHIN